MESVTLFYGQKDGFEDPSEYLESIDLAVNEKIDDPGKAAAIKQMVFRTRLRDEAHHWFQRLYPVIRSDWLRLSELFSEEFKLEARTIPNAVKIFGSSTAMPFSNG